MVSPMDFFIREFEMRLLRELPRDHIRSRSYFVIMSDEVDNDLASG